MKCAQCHEEKPESAFSKSQLKKGSDAKCTTCSAAAASTEPATSSSPTAKTKVCAQCKRSDRQFSKAQSQKKDGRCMECVQASESGTATSPKAHEQTPIASSPPTTSKPAAQPNGNENPKTKSPRSGSPQPQDDEDDGVRIACRSCQVFKPKSSFANESEFCIICADAKKKGIRQTTMRDHGLVASDGSSHRKLSWVPDNLKEYLAFMDEEAQSGRGGHQEEDDDGQGEYYEDEE